MIKELVEYLETLELEYLILVLLHELHCDVVEFEVNRLVKHRHDEIHSVLLGEEVDLKVVCLLAVMHLNFTLSVV